MNRLLFSFYFACCATILVAQSYEETIKQLTDKQEIANINFFGETKKMPVFEMVFVEGGTFTMGCTEEEDAECYGSEIPLHEVKIRDFYIGRHEVTQAQWMVVMGDNPSHHIGENLPVENVSWNDVQEFIRKLNKFSNKHYRLPTEAEWEYAARGGKKSSGYKYSGSNEIDEIAWHDDNSDLKTHPVGSRNPNELGIYDMSGNVYEWCEDWFNFNYYQKCKDLGVVSNPKSPDTGSSTFVIRGGGCISYSWDCRVSVRGDMEPDTRDKVVGFRLASSSK